MFETHCRYITHSGLQKQRMAFADINDLAGVQCTTKHLLSILFPKFCIRDHQRVQFNADPPLLDRGNEIVVTALLPAQYGCEESHESLSPDLTAIVKPDTVSAYENGYIP